MKKKKTITYSQVGDNYDTKDPIKKAAQAEAVKTSINLKKNFSISLPDSPQTSTPSLSSVGPMNVGTISSSTPYTPPPLLITSTEEMHQTRGESAFVWSQGNEFMASVVEGLGTKNLIADKMYELTGKSYYDVIGHDTVATIINDLVTVGARPLVVLSYWAIEDNSWLQDVRRVNDLNKGWREACDLAKASWGAGETPTLKGIIEPGTIDLGGTAIGIIGNYRRWIRSEKLQVGDGILLLKSNGINANGVSLARAIVQKLSQGYATKLPSGIAYGEALLTKTNIYAKLVQDLLDAAVNIHYISNITGHGLRKVMRAPQQFTYVIEDLFPVTELFSFIKKDANLSDQEMYGTFNMGQDYAIFLPQEDVKKAQEIVKRNGFESIDAGVVEAGERQVVVKPKGVTYKGETLDLR